MIDHATHAIPAPTTSAPAVTARTDACLIHIYPTGSLLGRRYAFGEEAVSIGRGEECTICIPDASVSRRHACIELTERGYEVADLGSTNGTFINDRRITGPTLLTDGDSLRTGKCLYRYLAGGNVEAEYHEEIYRMTILDGLTRIHNRRYLNEFLDLEIARSQRHARPLSLLLFDIDKFKTLNDTFGHLCGDFILRELATRLAVGVRKGDLFARYGGEEFAMVLVETSHDAAMEVGERVRSIVAGAPFAFDQRSHNVTISVGVACMTGEPSVTPTSLILGADSALYRAKREGRNRVVGYGENDS